jgi:hypothetical protein
MQTVSREEEILKFLGSIKEHAFVAIVVNGEQVSFYDKGIGATEVGAIRRALEHYEGELKDDPVTKSLDDLKRLDEVDELTQLWDGDDYLG